MSSIPKGCQWQDNRQLYSVEQLLVACTHEPPGCMHHAQVTCEMSWLLAGTTPYGVPAGLYAPAWKRIALVESRTAMPPVPAPLTSSRQGATPWLYVWVSKMAFWGALPLPLYSTRLQSCRGMHRILSAAAAM
jgi:hypothetical protein